MSKNTKFILIAVGAIVLLTLIAFMFKGGDRGTEVNLENAAIRTIMETVSASGKIQPETEVKISSEVNGIITELPVKEGDKVSKGELIVAINPDIYETSLSRAEAALNTSRSNLSSAKARKAQAKAQLLTAEQAYNRSKKLFDEKVISQAEYDQALSSFEVAKAELSAAEESINSAEYSIRSAQASRKEASDNLNRTTILAPQNGIVTALTKEIGESVLATNMMQGDIIMKVSDLSTMEVNVEVNESDIIRVNLGDTAIVEVDAYLDEEFKGLVTEIGNTALNSLTSSLSMDQVTNFSVKIRILKSSYEHLLTNKPETYTPFRPGMSATVEIRTDRKENVLTVPIKAVTTRQDTTESVTKKEDLSDKEPFECVFVYESGEAKIRPIKTGIQDNKYIVVLDGIKEDDEVITGPYDQVSKQLRPGKKVKRKAKSHKDSE